MCPPPFRPVPASSSVAKGPDLALLSQVHLQANEGPGQLVTGRSGLGGKVVQADPPSRTRKNMGKQLIVPRMSPAERCLGNWELGRRRHGTKHWMS